MIQIIAIIGPSASGKTTLKKALGLGTIITYTTRSPRNTEADGVDYLFVSQDKFNELIQEGKLLEHTNYHEQAYGMGLSQVEDAVQKGQKVVVVLDGNGAKKLKKLYSDKVLVLGTSAHYDHCKRRLEARNDDQTEIRLSTYHKEMEEMLTLADLIINTNDDHEKTVHILSEKLAQLFKMDF